jgi:hypothetical protein
VLRGGALSLIEHFVTQVVYEDKNSNVDATVPFMAPEEQATDALNRQLGTYFGASPLERSHTWASDDEYAQSPHNARASGILAGGRHSLLSDEGAVSPPDSENKGYWGMLGF